ncbi:MAG: VWA domain-containing protein [Pseudomonadota bacterium]
MRQLWMAAAVCCATSASAEDMMMIVMDASGSMWGQIDGVNKIVIARDVVRESLAGATLTQSVGLMAYGHTRKGDCSDIAVLVPPARDQIGAVAAAVGDINPKGKTPLTDAVRQAAATLRHTENPATVVLVTDGIETCNADPCALARELEQTGVDFTAHVVGFGLSRTDGAAVSCLAEETGGRYIKADNAGELSDALSDIVVAGITPETVAEEPPQVEPKQNLQINVQLTPDSPPLELGQIDKLVLDLIRQPDGKLRNIGYEPVTAVKVEAADYILRAKFEGGQVELPITVDRFDVTHATVSLNAGVVDFRALHLTPDLIDPGFITWEVTNVETGKIQGRFTPDLRSVFSPGTYDVRVVLGRKPAVSPPPVRIDITAGDVTEGEILMPHGALRVQALSESGERLPDSFVRFGLWTLKADGSRDRQVTNGNASDRPVHAMPGDYLLVVEDWGIAKGGKRKVEQAVTLQPGTAILRRVTLPADPAQPIPEVRP